MAIKKYKKIHLFGTSLIKSTLTNSKSKYLIKFKFINLFCGIF
jgi:hypothetical protein